MSKHLFFPVLLSRTIHLPLPELYFSSLILQAIQTSLFLPVLLEIKTSNTLPILFSIYTLYSGLYYCHFTCISYKLHTDPYLFLYYWLQSSLNFLPILESTWTPLPCVC